MGFFEKLSPEVGPPFKHYSVAYVFIDGKLLTEEASVSLEKKSHGSAPIFTLSAGLAGVSIGVPLIELSIQNAVPTADFELCPDDKIRTGSAVEVGIVMAGRQSIFKGVITEASYSHAVNDSSKLNLKLTCRYSDFE